MRLSEMLRNLGGRIGILEKEGSPPKSRKAGRMRTRTVTLNELIAEVRSEEVRTLAEGPAELSVPFQKIYEAAALQPSLTGWNLARLRQLLETPEFQGVAKDKAQRRILDLLAGQGVDPQALVREAVARDRALDAFEEFSRKKLEERAALRQRRLAEIDAERDKLQEADKEDSHRWRDWRKRKRAEEKDLAWIVGFLIEQQVISTGDEE